MDSSLLFDEGNVIEISGNTSQDYSFINLSNGEVKWNAAKYGPPAYMGRIVTKNDGIFYGVLMDLCAVNRFGSGQSYGETPVVGRFFKGRNDNIHVIFYTLSAFNCACWLKKKIEKHGYGIISAGKCSDEEWNSDCICHGYFSFKFQEFHVDNDEDRKASISVTAAEYERLLKKSENYSSRADEFINRFEIIKESMFDLFDKFEDIDKHEISYI